MMFLPRPAQRDVIEFRHGWMGVSAVPGSGKTQTLSYLATQLIAEECVKEGQEVLIVTLVNSAVDNFFHRIDSFVRKEGILPGMGYRVRTLHGLSHDIVRERPDLVGLSNRFEIIDEREADRILDRAVAAWLRSNLDFIQNWTREDLNPFRDPGLSKNWQELAVSISSSFIRQAKDMQATPAVIRERLDGLKGHHPLLEMGWQIYSDYQHALAYRGALDFDDLIRLALGALRLDPDYLARLRYRWPYILEDEAQDSSRLQEEILRTLAGENGNWVRVGDPNQAIFETFTTASPNYLRDFLSEPGVIRQTLPNSGRSTRSIINLANHLIDWAKFEHPNLDLRIALDYPRIEATPPGDPQPNPPDQPNSIYISLNKLTPEKELQVVVRSLKQWLPEHPQETVAVLVPRNERGARLVEELKNNDIPYYELLRSTESTRETAGILTSILRYLSEPAAPARLAAVYRELSIRAAELNLNGQSAEVVAKSDLISTSSDLLRRCARLEDYLQPQPGRDWLADLSSRQAQEEILSELSGFRQRILPWLGAALLPVDQLILTVAQELFTHPADLALAHKLALVLEHSAQIHPDWSLHEFTEELDSIAQNRRKFSGFSEDDSGFDPEKYKGKVVVATIHKAKGLEWDRVYLLSVNNYDYPSAEAYDDFMSEKWFIRGKLNLEAETLAHLKALLAEDIPGIYLEEGTATQEARISYAQERLRLLFVGITRARRELVITYNTGRGGNRPDLQPALALVGLDAYLKEQKNAAAP